ncbi:MAG: AAA family ATPase [Clostridia bacterium]|nr:AAA family ATPase [Clostridia bacterium]
MKLISCYVENYGKISKRKYDFDENMTSVCEANGYGKTTLASFLKAMFYGLGGYTKRTTDFNDRKKFFPFSGGKFGGNVVFEYAGDTYKIERFFDEKSEIKDELTVFKNGEEFFGFEGEIGE